MRTLTAGNMFRLQLALLLVMATAAVAAAQASNAMSLAGKYEGTAKGPNGDVKMALELINEAGKLSGQITSPGGVYKIVKADLADGLLTLEAERNTTKGKMVLRQKGDLLAGDFTSEGKTGPVEFKRAATEELTGEWEAVADAQGQPFPFLLTLKVEGEKVTGSSSSQLGNSPITTGTWKDGKLSVVMEGSAGQIALMATMVEGKLSGDYDFAGQLSGKWVAIKKK